MSQMKFERHEKKYLLSMKDYRRLLEALKPYLREDGYGMHTISSIYYDTEDYRLIRASLEKPSYKEKLRLRCYGVPQEESDVFLELKKKLDGVVYKRRIALPLWEAKDYLEKGIPPRNQGQIFQEIHWFARRYRPCPSVLLAYDRIALYDPKGSDLRITFDFRARWREDRLDLALGHSGQPLISPENCLMEIKTTGALPVWLCKILSEQERYPTSFSKYGVCYRNYLLAKGGMRHAG